MISNIFLFKYGPRYNWTNTEQSYLLGAFFWGYLVTTLPGGTISEWLGGKDVVTYSMAFSAIFTAVVPIFANVSVWLIFVIRLLTGVSGVTFKLYFLLLFLV